MTVGEMPPARLRAQLAGPGLRLGFGHIVVRIASEVPALLPSFRHLYADHRPCDDAAIEDAFVAIRHASQLRRLVAPIVRGELDGHDGFLPLPARAAMIMLESCLNWAVIGSGAGCLMLHAAAVERDGGAVILPAGSGSGKSTLCAALLKRGWRLLTDETVILRPADLAVLPLARPVSLKNDSIALVRALFGEAAMSPVFRGMPKGDMAYLRPPAEAVARIAEPALPARFLSPRFLPGEPFAAIALRPMETFRLILDNAVNYPEMQRLGFEMARELAFRCPAHRVLYGDLAPVLDFLDRAPP